LEVNRETRLGGFGGKLGAIGCAPKEAEDALVDGGLGNAVVEGSDVDMAE
jgi:hypothetical protein